ncbi:unnamed protein product [Agarophyton chilense]|eukprot:gb/GEZJ01005753.1/.p1 GENE.gb/GEZJ01005753.1/~~gb/GEZJ01005753.1/.p1  ORF type:complete len:163 (-),score=12.70 gb/GEZJ01005753.1/:1030-1518(-)
MRFSIFATVLVAAFTIICVHSENVAVQAVSPSKCSCQMPSSIKTGYGSDTTPVFKAEAVENREVGDPNYEYTVMRVKVTFRGCAPSNEYILVKSPKSACGVEFVPGVAYAVTAKLCRSSTPLPGLPASMETYTATSCSYNKPWNSCPYNDKVFLYYSPVEGC